jgi:hypothetical protein
MSGTRVNVAAILVPLSATDSTCRVGTTNLSHTPMSELTPHLPTSALDLPKGAKRERMN